MTAEEYFDSIYTYHTNDYVRMPLNELYELMEGYLKAHNKALNIHNVVGSFNCLEQNIKGTKFKCKEHCGKCVK